MLLFQRKEAQTPAETSSSPLPSTPGATPEPRELAQALSALEKKKADADTQMLHANSLRATLNEIQSPFSEEDIQVEIAQQREATRAEAAILQERKRQQKRKHSVIIGTVLVLPVLLFTLWMIYNNLPSTRQAAAERHDEFMKERIRESYRNQPKTTSLSLSPTTLVVSRTPDGPRIRTWSEIPNGEMVEVGDTDIYSIPLQDSATELMERAKRGGVWRVIKYDGKPYLRGYLTTTISANALRQGNIWITNVSSKGTPVTANTPFDIDGPASVQDRPKLAFVVDHPTAITIPLDGLQTSSHSGGAIIRDNHDQFIYTQIASGIHPDSHLFEPWSDPHTATKGW